MTPAAHKRLGLVAFAYAYRAVAGVLVALPAAAAIGWVTTSYPRGHAELFDPGAVMLVEALRFARRSVPAVVASAAPIAVVTVLGAILPLGALLVGLSTEGKVSAGFLAARTFRHAGTLALLVGLGALAQASVIGLSLVLGAKIVGLFAPSPPAEDWGLAIELGVGLVLAATLGVVRDLASAAAVRGDHGLHAATSIALVALRDSRGGALVTWAWRAGLGTFGLVVAAALTPRAAGSTAAATALAILIHQAAIAGATFAHATWLAAALRLVGAEAGEAPPPQPGQTRLVVDQEASLAPTVPEAFTDEDEPAPGA